MPKLEDLQDEVIAIKKRLDALESAPAPTAATAVPEVSPLSDRVAALEAAVYSTETDVPATEDVPAATTTDSNQS